jgi:hypothetical protein
MPTLNRATDTNVTLYGRRCAFAGTAATPTVEVWTRDVLNVGVRPDSLIQAVRARFEAKGGVVREGTALGGLEVHTNGVRAPIRPIASAASELQLDEAVSGRLVLDAMVRACLSLYYNMQVIILLVMERASHSNIYYYN